MSLYGSLARPITVPDPNSSTDASVPVTDLPSNKRTRNTTKQATTVPPVMQPPGRQKQKRKPVHQRWFYEEVVPAAPPSLLISLNSGVQVGRSLLDPVCLKDAESDDLGTHQVVGDHGTLHSSGIPNVTSSGSEVIASVIPTAMDSNTADSELAHSFSPAGGASAPLPLRTLATLAQQHSRFTIKLHFPDHERSDQTYSVSLKLPRQ